VWDQRVATFWDEPERYYDDIDDLHERVARHSPPPEYDNWNDV
jgi:hypothetical protein